MHPFFSLWLLLRQLQYSSLSNTLCTYLGLCTVFSFFCESYLPPESMWLISPLFLVFTPCVNALFTSLLTHLALPVWLMSQGPFTLSWAVHQPFLQPQATPHTTAPASRTCLSIPTPKKQVGPTGLLQLGLPLHTTCFGAIISLPFTSDTAWCHGQGQEECER